MARGLEYKVYLATKEFDAHSNLTSVACLICSKVDGKKKMIVIKGENLEKHEGKRICNKDGIPYLGLKVGDI
jgi:hypothetical protein